MTSETTTNATFTTTEEARARSDGIRILWRYVRAVPYLLWVAPVTFVMAIASLALQQLFVWLSGKFTECSSTGQCGAVTLPAWVTDIPLEPTVQVLAMTAILTFVIRMAHWLLFEVGGVLASRSLFATMIRKLGGTRTTFFDEYPSGKILNRIIKDGDSLRLLGPIRLGDTLGGIAELLVAAVVIACANPIVGLFSLPILGIFIFIQRTVAPMVQRVVMLRSARFGEVLHRETDIIEGSRCFELYGHRPALVQRLRGTLSQYMQMHFLRGRIEAWGRLCSDLAVALYTSAVLVVVYLGISSGTLSAVMGAVILTTSGRLGKLFLWLSWSLGMLLESAGHARRVFEYVDLPPEEALERAVPPTAQPTTAARAEELPGDLSFGGYSMSYRPGMPLILDNLTLTIKRGSSVGIIGRTGAGKSSLVQALFRMVYVQAGDIRIGEQSLLALPVAQARALFAVVPQDPYLFEGTVRSNIDWGGEYTDAEIEQALRTVQLPLDLALPLLEGGSNLSVGQRQLLCLARVILSKRPIVIMDEPTSGVDTVTDAIVQGVLRTALVDRTVITIAHRLETLAHVDRVIELANGTVLRDVIRAE